jgi:ketosteroid isomerase-like protein
MQRILVAVVLLGLFLAPGCRPAPDPDSLRREILALHESFIQAHLDKDATFLAAPTADDYLSVSSGEVRAMSATDVEAMLAPYLAETEFSHYHDVAEPIVGVSEDGSLAWSIVQVRVAGTRTGQDGQAHTFDTLWAWLTLYRRDGDRWQRIADVSTNRAFAEPS